MPHDKTPCVVDLRHDDASPWFELCPTCAAKPALAMLKVQARIADALENIATRLLELTDSDGHVHVWHENEPHERAP